MLNCNLLCACLLAALLSGTARQASAQTFETVGVRAQGLGGAFVAVADDATASWWNPAGLATGAYLSSVVEHVRFTAPANPPVEGPATRTTAGDFAVSFPALGLSYYRLRVSEIADPGSTAAGAGNRQDPVVDGSSVRSAAISQFGTTVGQSIGSHLVIGTTLKLLYAGAVSSSTTGSSPLDEADDLDVQRHFQGDLDAGAMAKLGHLRLGVTVRNVFEPSFDDEGLVGTELTLKRQARAGVAFFSVPNGSRQGVMVAADADLTTTSTVLGDVRHAAVGFESWMANKRVGLRAGFSTNTVNESRPAGSLGVSVALKPSVYVNAAVTEGRDESVTGWSTGVSVSY